MEAGIRYLSPKELARELGVSRWTVYGWLSAGYIRYRKLGRLVRIPSSEIPRLLGETEAPRVQAIGSRDDE